MTNAGADGYSVTLTIADDGGAISTVTQQVVVCGAIGNDYAGVIDSSRLLPTIIGYLHMTLVIPSGEFRYYPRLMFQA